MVVADLHFEKGSAMARRSGRMLPPYDSHQTLDLLLRLMRRHRPKRVIALGDSFHDADGSARLDQKIRSGLRTLIESCDWIWILGNHDPRPPKDLGGTCFAELSLGPVTFRHYCNGETEGLEVFGHYHPAACVATRGRSFRRRCFVFDGDRLLLPAFGAYAGGLNVRDPAISSLFSRAARVAILGQDRLHAFPLAACLPDAQLHM